MSDLRDPGFAITTAGLTKTFGETNVVEGLDLRVPRGAVFGFLGPNGSGKTTTIRMLLGLAGISRGSISLLGYAVPGELSFALPKVGALVEGPAFYPYLSGRDNLARFDSADRHADPATRTSRIESALARVGLTAAAAKKVHAYSLGMKQRLGIATALLQPRELLILDEPTNGLDPQGTREVRNLIRSLAADNITIFVSSHLLSEIEQICTHLAVMSRGSLVAQGSLAELSQSDTLNLVARTTDAQRSRDVLAGAGVTARVDGDELRAVVPNGKFAPEDLVAALVGAGIGVQSFSLAAPSLEDRFVSLTGEGFDVAR